MKVLKALFTDRDWDADLTKVVGFAVIVVALVGWFVKGNDPTVVLGFGSALIASGKFSKEG